MIKNKMFSRTILVSAFQELLRQERNKNVKLETKLQRLEMERIGIARVNTGYGSKCSKSFANVASRENVNSEKMQLK